MWGAGQPRQWRVLGSIGSRKHGVTAAQFLEEEACHPCTIWRDLVAIEPPGLTLLLQSDQEPCLPRRLEGQPIAGNSQQVE